MTAPPPQSAPTAATEVSFRPLALGSSAAAFVLIGTTASLFGPLLDTFARHFHLSVPTAGEVLSVFFAGGLFGVLLTWVGLKRYSGRAVLAVDLAVLSVGALGASLVHPWAIFLCCIFVVGLGYGGLDMALNVLLARTQLKGRARRLSVVNAGFGLGAVMGPVLIIAVHPRHFGLLFGGVALVAIALATLTRGVHAPPLRAEENQRRISQMKTERRPILATFVAAYILYICFETSSSGWLATQVHGVGFSGSIASLATAGFWGGAAVSRMVGGPVHRVASDRQIVLGGLCVAAALALCSLVTPLAPYAYPALGLAAGLIFPMGLVWYTVLCPHDSDGLSLMILLMMSGGVIGPSTTGLMVSIFGVRAVPFVIASFALADAAVFTSALRFSPLITS